jgi:hypothetical protein
MMTLSLAAGNGGRSLSLVKFVLPLECDAFNLPRALAAIDAICHRGALAHEVVAVDDATPDGTAAEARRFAHFMPLWLIQHTRSMGRAVAFRTGVEAACRDACDEDLLVPIDPRRWPDAGAALNAIVAARSGWDAVLTSAGRGAGRRRGSTAPALLAVYRMGLVKRHLASFLETSPGDDSEAVHQLDRYFLAAGITFFRLPAPLPAQPALRTSPDAPVAAGPLFGRAS